MEKTRASPLHSQHPGLAAGPEPRGSRDKPGRDQHWRYRGTKRGELPKGREKLASQDKEELTERGPCVKVGWEAKRGSWGTGLHRGKPARDGAMSGLQGWRELGDRRQFLAGG